MSFVVVKSPDDLGQLGEQELEEIYTWVDSIPLSRPKRNITRDFSDGVMVAEVVRHYLPKLVEVHNYSPANATPPKMQNWFQLNRKVFKKLRFELSEDVIRSIANCNQGVVEGVLAMLRTRMERVVWETQQKIDRQTAENERPEADQNSFRLVHQIKIGDIMKEGHVRQIKNEEVKNEEIKNEEIKNGEIKNGESVKEGSQRKDKPSAEQLGPNTGPYRGMNTVTKSKSDQVPLLLLEEKEQEILAKDETIQIMNAKIKRLEHLLHLKDIRIEDLQARLETSRPTGKR